MRKFVAVIGIMLVQLAATVAAQEPVNPVRVKPTSVVPSPVKPAPVEPAPVVPTPAVPAEIEADLKALSSPEYQGREAAARRLLSRKLDAVAPLTLLAQDGPAEASVCAFDLLRRIYREGDDATNEAVESAFESLVRGQNPTVAARAESAIEAAAPIRHARAIIAFRKLGGIIRYAKNQDGVEERPADDESSVPIKYAMLGTEWTGGDEGLKHLRRIEDFRIQSEVRGATLYVIKKSKVSAEAVADLQASLPNLNIQKRGPACFGVSPSIPFGGQAGLQIHLVEPGSAADRAGLRPGDYLLKFNDFEVPDFDTLVDKIGDKLPGDKVPVLYERNGTVNTTIVELRAWE